MSPKFNPPNLLIGQPRHQPTMSRDELRAAIKRLREIDALTHPEPTPDPGSPCKAHKEAGFVYSVIGCPRCYPEPTPESVACAHPVYCTGGCDACRDYARELGVPLIVPEKIPSKRAFYLAIQRLYDETDTRNGLVIHNVERAVDAIRAALFATPATPQADRGDGLREALAGCDYIELVGDPLVKAYVAAIRAALRDTAPSGLDVETLAQAVHVMVERAWGGRGASHAHQWCLDEATEIAAEYARLRESADQERTEGVTA